MIRTILVPLDGSPLAERALPIASQLASALSAQLVLACVAGRTSVLGRAPTGEDRQAISELYSGVTEEDHLLSTDPWMAERAQGQVRAVAEADRYLAGLATGLRQEGVAAEVAVAYGEAIDGILTEMELHSVDLVVMSTHGRSGLSRMLGGSVAQGLLTRSPVPVLLVPPDRR